jgi:hypothetical protein
MRVVAAEAVSLRSRMRDFGTLDQGDGFRVASDAKLFGIGFDKDHFAVLGRQVAGIARFIRVRTMHEFLDQLRPIRLVHGVAGQAIRLLERLPLVGCDKRLARHIMAPYAERVRVGTQMKIGFRISPRSLFVNDVTGVAPHIEGGMPAPIRGNAQPVAVTFEAEVLLLVPRKRFDQVVLIGGIMRIMARRAIPGNWRVQQSFSRSGLFIWMALEA